MAPVAFIPILSLPPQPLCVTRPQRSTGHARQRPIASRIRRQRWRDPVDRRQRLRRGLRDPFERAKGAQGALRRCGPTPGMVSNGAVVPLLSELSMRLDREAVDLVSRRAPAALSLHRYRSSVEGFSVGYEHTLTAKPRLTPPSPAMTSSPSKPRPSSSQRLGEAAQRWRLEPALLKAFTTAPTCAAAVDHQKVRQLLRVLTVKALHDLPKGAEVVGLRGPLNVHRAITFRRLLAVDEADLAPDRVAPLKGRDVEPVDGLRRRAHPQRTLQTLNAPPLARPEPPRLSSSRAFSGAMVSSF